MSALKQLSFFIIVFLIMGSFRCEAQNKINQVDTDGNRIGLWKKYHPNKRIRYEGQFINGKESGVFKYYSPLKSDHPIAIKTFKENSDVASVEFFTVEGKIQSKGSMNGKERIGKWVYFHPDGETMMAEEQYENGKLNGESKTFFLDGKLTEIVHYSEGKKNGLLQRYSVEGVLLDELNYKNGKLHGLAKYFTTDGSLRYTGNYENDKKVGKWEYFEDGKPVSADKIKKQ